LRDKGLPMRIPRSEWRLWDHVMVRSAGFAVDGLDRFRDARLAAAADSMDGETGLVAYDRAWSAYSATRSARIAAILDDPRFQSAVLWQSPALLDSGLAPLRRQIRDGKPRNHKLRVRERTVTAYWQRYCAKSESIGFFGPVAWARVRGEGTLVAHHGPSLVDGSRVCLEGWGIGVLARQLAGRFDLRPWLAPRRAPQIGCHDGRVTTPDGRWETADALTLACLRQADGRTLPPQLVPRIVADCGGDAGEAEVRRRLDDLHRKGWLVWRFELGPTAPAETELESLLIRCGTPEAEQTLAVLTRMASARARAEVGWQQPEPLAQALACLEREFMEATRQPGRRHEGSAYAGRTLAYLDCRRDLTVDVGAELVRELEPVGFVLDTLRWVSERVRAAIMAHLNATYRRLSGGVMGTPNACMLWGAILPGWERTVTDAVGAAMGEAQSRWAEILGLPDTAESVSFSAGQLREAVRDRFGSAQAGWTEARWCCPDVMIAASSEAAIRCGDYRLVLGEVHAAINTLDFASMVGLHPCPQDLIVNLDRDHPGPRTLVAAPREARPRLTARSQPVLVRDHDYRLLLGPNAAVPSRGVVVAGADIAIVADGSRLMAVLPDGYRCDVMDLFAEPLKAVMAQAFSLFPRTGHHPRVTIDRVIVARRGWTFPAEQLSFVREPDEHRRFAAVRAWRRREGLPEKVFVKSPLEVKPFYVDFMAPPYTELLVSAVRRLADTGSGTAISLVEMVPGAEDAWLTDTGGRRYVSELRFVAFDLGEQPVSA